MTPTKIALLSFSRTIKHITTSICLKYKIELFFNEADVSSCDIILIDDGANGLSYDKYKTSANRVALMVNEHSKALGIVDKYIDKIIYKPFLPNELASLILKLENKVNKAYRQSIKQKIHHNFLVDSTIIHEQKENAHNESANNNQVNEDNIDDTYKQTKQSQTISDFVSNKDTKNADESQLLKELDKGVALDKILASKNILDNIEYQKTKQDDNKKSEYKGFDIELNQDNKSDLNDDSVVKKSELGEGGILNSDDILSVQKLLNEADGKKEIIGQIDTLSVQTQPDEWDSISQIIDESIKEYTLEVKEPLRFVLNAYSIRELEPFFEKLDSEAVQSLIDGGEISLDVKLKND